MSRRRIATRVVGVCLGLVFGLIVLVSCVSGSGGAASNGGGSASLPTMSEPPPTTETATSSGSALAETTRSPALAPAGAFPATLVGSWSGEGNKSLTFTADGLFYGNTGLHEGRAVVSGNRITLTPLGGSPVVTTWSVDGGRLYLGTSVYLRDDAGSGSLSLVGTWIEVDGYAQFRFGADGTYDFADPAHNRSSAGTYAVAGQVLTISPGNRPPATFGLQYDGTTLTFLNTDGTSVGNYLRAG